MDDQQAKPTRRELLASTVGIAGAVWLAACDDDSSGSDAGPGGGADAGPGGGSDAGPGGGADAGPGGDTDAGPVVCNSVAWMMGSRHPPGFRHSIDVPVAHVMMGVEQTYDIQGESPHPHTVVVTPADFARIAAGEMVVITSSEDMGTDLHDHDVTLFCSA